MPDSVKRQIFEKLVNASDTELNSDALEKILEAELNKPTEAIDAGLIREVIDELEPEMPSEEVKQQVWAQVQKGFIPHEKKTYRLLRRFGVIAAIIVLLLGLLLGSASANPWTFLLKLLQPLAETFGIYMNYSDNTPTTTPAAHQYAVSAVENTAVLYSSLDELPDSAGDYAIKPRWLPEGFSFQRGSLFEEGNMQAYHLDYLRGTDEINILINIHADPEAVVSYTYEQTTGETSERMIGTVLVTFYRNANDKWQLVSWIDGCAHYNVSGQITVEEMEQLIAMYSTGDRE